MRALRHLGVGEEILTTDPETWDNCSKIKEYSTVVQSLKVTNDVAERAVALMTDCNNGKRTKDESELQNMLQVKEESRKRLKTVKKSDLASFEIRK